MSSLPQSLYVPLYRKQVFARFVLIVTFLVGLVGLSLPVSRALFIWLTPVHLLVQGFLLAWASPLPAKQLAITALPLLILAWAYEWLGVHTGSIFGSYAYGPTLGLAIDGVPLLIGLNWWLLVVASCSLASRFVHKAWAVALVAASLMVALDVLLEPVAMKLNFWQWPSGHVPLQNYAGWWAGAFVLCLAYSLYLSRARRLHPTAEWLYLLQILFFGLLNITLAL